jgi:hypothetical protein
MLASLCEVKLIDRFDLRDQATDAADLCIRFFVIRMLSKSSKAVLALRL